MNSQEIRSLFTRFFEERGHKPIPSSSLIPPPEERTLLFANAGMNQVKPYFMGLARPPAPRMTSVQKCFRTSDIEEVGDGSHCTFFEMLGNFSVGDASTLRPGSGQAGSAQAPSPGPSASSGGASGRGSALTVL